MRPRGINPRGMRRTRRALRAAAGDLVFALVGAALCFLCAWPLAQTAQAMQSAPNADTTGAQIRGVAPTPRPPTSAPASQSHARGPLLAVAARAADTKRGVNPAAAAVRIAGDVQPRLPTRSIHASPRQQRQLLTITVVLKRTDQAGFNRYLQQVYDRSSPIYDHFPSASYQADRFGPSASEYNQLRAWLVAEGFRVTQTSANRLSLSVRGTRAEAERAFQTPIRDFSPAKRAVYANVEAPAVPRALANDVQAVIGLTNTAEPTAEPQKMTLDEARNYCNALINQVNVNLPIGDDFFSNLIYDINILLAELDESVTIILANAYCAGVTMGAVHGAVGNPGAAAPSLGWIRRRNQRSATVTGAPQKIGMLEFDTYEPSDVTDWLNLLGFDPSIAGRLQEVNVNGGAGSPGAGESEVLLDIDTILSQAPSPSASYVVYDAPPDTSFVQMFQTMIADHDTVISNSWYECEDQVSQANADAIDSVLASAAASGVTVVNATGDYGSACSDGSASTVAVPADSPHATAVGGTTPTLGPGWTYGSEAYWNEQSAAESGGAGGFGVSRFFARPAYQDGLTSSSMRSLPDLSMDADPLAGLELCEADAGGCPQGVFSGGTSMSAPLVAAQMADLNEALGHNLGDLNAVLYSLAGTNAFHTPQSMGSDFAHVGLGTPNITTIYQYLSKTAPGAPSAASPAGAIGEPQADGSQQGLVRVDLEDANGLPVGGKSVTLTPDAGSRAVVSPASATTDSTDGAAVFTVTDTTPEQVTFTVKDTTDSVTLTTQPTLTFVAPVATGASISANPTMVASDGTSQTTISVYLQNALGQPAVGKTVSLSDNGGNATITPVSGQAVTDSTGTATFTATDSTEQAVAFTATDVTDNNLPVPGSATVNFEPSGGSQCSDAAPTAAAGYSIAPFVSGLAFNAQAEGFGSFTLNACSGPFAPAFDSSGVAYVPDLISGQIFRFGPSGGTADAMTALPETSFAPAQLGPLAFDKSGTLYAGLLTTGGSFSSPELVQVDPTTGATERVVADSSTGVGLLPCPSIAVDPVSGDVFSNDGCTGFLASNELVRISNPQSANPTVTDYADLGGQSGGMAFAPDGTLYVAMRGLDTVVEVTGTNAAQPATVTTVATLPNSPSSVAIASTNSSGQATALYVGDFAGNITRIDLTQDPATTSPVATSSGGFVVDAAVGPDGCLYTNGVPTLLKVSGPGCSQASAGPEITLEQSSGSSTPATGSPVSLTAALLNFRSPSGTPVHFTISGPNLNVKLVNAIGDGHATMSYAGVLQGVDTVTASTIVNGNVITSAPVDVHWTAGKDTTFLDLNASQQAGPTGRPATLTASLVDVTHTPPATLSGQSVTLSLAGKSCTAQTNGAGVASCKLTPASAGLLTLTGSYAGNSQYTASTGSNIFVAGALGLETVPPRNTAPPKISGKANAGKKLSCSTGSWSNYPIGYTYQWNRDGTPIDGATSSTYKVQAVDEGITLTCSVTASNGDGPGKPATSKGDRVPVPKVARCPAATGKLKGTTLGLLHLGMTRAQALHAYRRSSTRGKRYQDYFCLTPRGVRVGIASPDVLKALPRSKANKLKGRVIWASTSSDYYSVHTIRPGASVATARKHLKLTKPIQVGKNTWYLAANGASTAVFKVRKGVIEEIGIGDKQLTRSRKAQRTFLTSFS
jgi:Pro-kumamolisin, activation domain